MIVDGPSVVIPGRVARGLLPLVRAGLAEAARRGVVVDRAALEAAGELEAAAGADRARQAARAQAALAERISAASAENAEMLDGTAEAGGSCGRMSAAAASHLLGVTAHRVRQLRAAGVLLGWRGAGGRWEFDRDDVEALAASRARGT